MSERWRQLTYLPPEKIEVELFPEHYLNEEVNSTRKFFANQRQEGTIDIIDPFITARVFVWQYVDYLPKRPDSYYDYARGYLMVEPEDIPTAARLLDATYTIRKTQGNPGQFKWLTRKLPSIDLSTDEWWHETHKKEKVGLYEELSNTDPRIVLYERSPLEIQEILAALAANPEWQAIESNRTKNFSNEISPIRGTCRFADDTGNQWNTLSYNAKVGHSDEQY